MDTPSSQNVEAADALARAAEDQAKAGQLPASLELFQRAIALDPNNAKLLDHAARVALKIGDLQVAFGFAQRAVKAFAAAPFVVTLADVLRAGGQFDAACRYYEAILKDVPESIGALAGLAGIYEQAGYRTLAIEYYKKVLAIAPKDAGLARRLSKTMSYQQSQELLEIFEGLRPTSSASAAERLNFEAMMVTRKEYAERVKHGVPAQAESMNDMFFRFAVKERDRYEAIVDAALASDPVPDIAIAAKANCLLARGERREALKYYGTQTSLQTRLMFAIINFNDDFFDALEAESEESLIEGLVPLIHVVTPEFADRPIIFFSSDSRYFQDFVRPFLISIDEVSRRAGKEKLQVHVHIMDPTDENLAEVKSLAAKLDQIILAVSAEHPNERARNGKLAGLYFHAIRFVRMYQILNIYQKPLWLMDVDGLMHDDPRRIFDAIGSRDIGLFGHPGRWEPWMQFNASMVGIRPVEKAKTFLRLVAGYIRYYHKRNLMEWGIDQLALYAVYAHLKDQGRSPDVMMVPNIIDGECHETSIVWSNGGPNKFAFPKLAASATIGPPDSPRVRYMEALNKYMDRLARL
jgi:tetratricopeptide (TPR) repeat protein